MSRRARSNQEWEVRASTLARKTKNLIRCIIENLQVEPNPDKELIALSIGKCVLAHNFFHRSLIQWNNLSLFKYIISIAHVYCCAITYIYIK